ncbi:MAG: maltose alpha-D-glucosyltransferase [Anaerolineaceae bacterium]|nr:maltose alpha-D-glucosyltransferase [Anaerolineaceae bacterium]
MQDSYWYKDAVFYEVYVRAFFDSNADGHGDLPGLLQKLDYLQALGVDCLWLMPVYPSPLKDDGYDIASYYGIQPVFGSLDDFKELVEAAHARGIRIIMDLVLNHTSDQHPWFQLARSDPNSPYRDYYVWSDSDQHYKDARIIFLDTEKSNWTWDEVAGQYYWHRFYASQPDLNYDNPAVQAEMINVAKFWLDLGIDGFRADAIPYLFEREGTNCENLPETHAYLKQLRSYVERHYPGRILLCEANQWPQDVRPYFGEGDEFHMGFHFPVMPRIFMSIHMGDRTPLAWILEHTPEIPSSCQWCTFLRNHDELTLEMVTEEERQWMWQVYAPEPRMRLNLGIRRRLAPLLDYDRRRIELANSLLFTLPGSPILYYGDEIGMGDNIWLTDRNGVRTPMQWNDGPNAGFSQATPNLLYTPVIEDPISGPEVVNVARQQADAGSLLNLIRRMIALRKQHPAFGRGSFAWLQNDCEAVAAFQRALPEDTLWCFHNLSAEAQSVPLPEHPGQALYDLFTGRVLPPSAGQLDLEPYQYVWLCLQQV